MLKQTINIACFFSSGNKHRLSQMESLCSIWEELRLHEIDTLSAAVKLLVDPNFDILLIDPLSWEKLRPQYNTMKNLHEWKELVESLIIVDSDQHNEALQAIDQGISDYIKDPFTDKELQHRIVKLINRRKVLKKIKEQDKAALVDYLTTTLAHELNNPLTAILGYTQLLKKNADYRRTEILDILNVIEDQTERIKDVSRRLVQLKDVQLEDFISGKARIHKSLSESIQKSRHAPIHIRKRQTILIGDDDKSVRDFLADVLDREGYNVMSAAGGREIVAIQNQQPADLVLLDIKLPDISGLEVLHRLMEEDLNTKVLMITGYIDNQEAAEAISQGALGCIFKPFHIQEILDSIERILKF